MAPENAAVQLLTHLGVYGAMLGTRAKYRTATPERRMRKGEDGQRKPGGFGRGLRNWINRQQKNALEARRA